MTTLGIRLRQARKDKKLSQKALAELVGIKQQAVQRIERGDVKNTCYIVQLAHALEVSPDWLAAGKEWQPRITYASESSARYTPAHVLHAPLLKWSHLDKMSTPSLELENYNKVPLFNAPEQHCFALQIPEEIPYPLKPAELIFNKNDILLVQTQRIPQSDELVIAKLPNQPEAIFARYAHNDEDKPFLKLITPQPTTPIPVSNDVEILGVVFMRYTQLG
jgi:transcriptional regulator with XRE-family HTH domain